MAAPLVFASVDRHEWITIGIMYAETMLVTHAVKDFIKAFTFRPRPYMYFDGYPQRYVDSGDWNNSFPSGHTMQAFAAAAFTSFVFAVYFPRSLWNIPVSALSYSVAAANNMQMKLTNKEPLGSETHLYVVTNKGQNLIVKTSANADFRLGDTLNFVPNMEKAKFFSMEEGEPNICDKVEKKW